MTSRLKLITIDAFGTIFTFKESPIRTYCRIFSNHGYKCSEQSVSNHFKASMKRQNEMWPYYGATSGMTSKQWWIALVHSTSKGKRLKVYAKKLTANVTTIRAHGNKL